ncbi:MAG TPA: DUF6019 family protein [Actinomycetes bacterium]|nr:DUF6019 family protein [Actinomycetes bacterium]
MGYLIILAYYAIALMALYYVIKRAVANGVNESHVRSDVAELRNMVDELVENRRESA